MTNCRTSLLFLLSFLLLGVSFVPLGMPSSNVASVNAYSVANTPDRETPPKLREVWLRFHKDNLCEKVDAGFVFHRGKMEVLVNIGNGKSNGKFFDILEPLHSSSQIKLHTVRLQTEQELIDIRNTPPSFWLNSRLTEYLRDSFLRDTSITNFGLQSDSTGWTSSIMFGQRMLMFARDTLDYNRKIRLYAAHLPLLALAAFDPQIAPALRNQALDVCRAHVKKLEKYTKKLNGNLARALPKTTNKSSKTTQSEDPSKTDQSSIDIALRLTDEADDLSRLVYRFIYPQSHTVELADLLNPTLLQSLQTLRQTTAEFQNSID